MITVSNIKVPPDDDNIEKYLGIKLLGIDISSFEILRKSIDARRKNDVHYVYSVNVISKHEDRILKRIKNTALAKTDEYSFSPVKKISSPIVIVGSGPAGSMCALTLAKNGYRVILLERGKCVEERKNDVENFWKTGILNTESNVQFGEGGAGTFSDGKLTTGINDIRIRHVLKEYVNHGAPEEILYLAKPHVGTDKLFDMNINIRRDILAHGGEIRFGHTLKSLKIKNGKICGALVSHKGLEYTIDTEHIVLAIGHSARDTFKMLLENGVNMIQKPFSVGVRIEHLQENISRACYGEFYKLLPPADYKMAVHLPQGRSAYTFCMCPGGEVVSSASEEGGIVTNGMSRFARSQKNANSALLVNVVPDDFNSSNPLAGIEFQRRIEKNAFSLTGKTYRAPCQRVGDFLKTGSVGKESGLYPSIRPEPIWTDIRGIFPSFVTDTLRQALPLFDKKLRGFSDPNAILTAPETRSSSPVRIIRGEDFQSNIKGLYPCGEGAGYAGGITSAAVDGIKTAEAIANSKEMY